ncbi:uncharacterized protein LOC124370088 [Homalodisca vitripennis]|uniref:uncharacterized protein LOC124370088 n=1 Tax=Homalodisca vitripennis TaxID=197043 RepID=UPI001EEC7239|nr:uncharacterized protein LOC124370088 [Homalodisca vitripennis]XP_046684347.1 uncharacterized protein LOC124370088 [Homalodisca vitripennis]XP_046684352.1 uncharacterized protein LOC124370088 [Homalodisca vitripennis]
MKEIPSPIFLNSEFLAECLRNELRNQQIIVQSYNTSRAVPPGENFNCCPLRVRIYFKNHPEDSKLHFISIIIKADPNESQTIDAVNTFHFTEIQFYSKFIPEIRKLASTQLAPKSLFSPKVTIVILEDLQEQGFKMAKKAKMLDFDHCLLYFKSAAILHAVSFVVHQNNPSLLEYIGKEKLFAYDLEISVMIKNCIRNGQKCLSECAEKTDIFKKYSQLIKETIPFLWDMLVEALKPSAVLNTINQGDPWTTNMMFKYDEGGNVCDIRLLDFQLVRYGSPVSDLVYFIWTSATHEVRSHRLDELYHVYVEIFNKTLRELNCNKSISYELIRNEERRLSPLAIYLMAMYRPFNSENSVTSVEPFFCKENEDQEVQNIYRKYYDEEFCSYHVPRYLEQLESVGVFHYLEQCRQLRN